MPPGSLSENISDTVCLMCTETMNLENKSASSHRDINPCVGAVASAGKSANQKVLMLA